MAAKSACYTESGLRRNAVKCLLGRVGLAFVSYFQKGVSDGTALHS